MDGVLSLKILLDHLGPSSFRLIISRSQHILVNLQTFRPVLPLIFSPLDSAKSQSKVFIKFGEGIGAEGLDRRDATVFRYVTFVHYRSNKAY